MMKANRILHIILLAIFVVSTSFSQIEITRNITIDDGLAYSQVTCSFTDSKGIMWLGTSAGLSEWNSVNFKNYDKSDGLPSTFISSICSDNENNIYVGTSKGLVIKTENKFAKPKNSPKELQTQINKVFLSQNGLLIILTENKGLWVKKDDKFSKIELENKNDKFIPTSILERKSGEILIGTRNSGIFQFSKNKLRRKIFHPIYRRFNVVDMIDTNGDSLYIALQGLGVVINTKNGEHKGNTYITVKNGLPSKYINSLLRAENGDIYVATSDGVAVIIGEKIKKIINKLQGLTNEFVLKTVSLGNNSFLFLTEGSGIFIYEPDAFVTYTTQNGLINNNIWAIEELNDGSFCFLTDDGISILRNNTFESLTKENGLGDNLAVTIYEDKNSNLFVGTYTDGVNVLKNGKVKRLNEKVLMPLNAVWSIHEIENGKMLFVTHTQGVAVFDGNKVIDTLGTKNGLPHTKISSSYKRKDGTILVGLENSGIYQLKNNRFTPFCDSIKHCLVWAIYEDNNRNLYFGTNEEGLITYSAKGIIDTISTKDGMSDNSIVAISIDNFGNIYAATDRGLNIIQFDKKGNFKIRNLFKKSGLADSECNQSAIHKDSKGNIWVGTIGGVTKINPQKLDGAEVLFPINITKIKVMENEITDFENLIFEYDQNDISFNFAGINYKYPGTAKYRYKLSNIDEDWVENNRNEVRYANLPAGKYEFWVATRNQWRVWSEPTSISFEITLPFWKTWWFIGIVLILFVSTVITIVYWRFTSLIKFERLRTNISADLHDEIGSGLSEISILIELLKFNPKNEKELIKGLDHIGDTTRSLIERLSDIIWIVNPRKETIKNLILRIQDSYQEVFYHSDISLNIINIELLENIVLPLEIKQNLYLITKEAINNALKHSNCNNIDFEVNKKENKLCIEIRDDGKGFEEENSQKGNGLYNIKRRAEKINAVATINSSKDLGTKIRVEVYLKKSIKAKND